jgi:hypothetical protein
VRLCFDGGVHVSDELVDQLPLENCATGRRDIGFETDPALKVGAGQRAAIGAAIIRVEVVDAAGEFLTEQPLVDVLCRTRPRS